MDMGRHLQHFLDLANSVSHRPFVAHNTRGACGSRQRLKMAIAAKLISDVELINLRLGLYDLAHHTSRFKASLSCSAAGFADPTTMQVVVFGQFGKHAAYRGRMTTAWE